MKDNERTLKYNIILEELKKQILEGAIQPGDKLPSENELSDKYSVSRQTIRKALAILQNEGYIYAEHGRGTFCSELARHMHTSKNIAVVLPYLSDYIFPRVIQGIDEVMEREGYSILLKNTKNSRNLEAKCIQELLQKDIDGIIIEPSKSQIYCRHTSLYEKLEQYKIPYVFIQGCFKTMMEKPHVLMDDEKGAYIITKYLTDLGHRNIVGVFKSDDIQGQNRHKGYVRALQDAGIRYEPDKVIWFYTEDRAIHPYKSIHRMLENGETVDGVVCYNDQIAVGVIRAIQECGLRIPEDISVTGYDNSYMSVLGGLHLTTIVHPQEQLGRMAAELLTNIIRGKDIEETSIMIEPELIEGNSCCKRNK